MNLIWLLACEALREAVATARVPDLACHYAGRFQVSRQLYPAVPNLNQALDALAYVE